MPQSMILLCPLTVLDDYLEMQGQCHNYNDRDQSIIFEAVVQAISTNMRTQRLNQGATHAINPVAAFPWSDVVITVF